MQIECIVYKISDFNPTIPIITLEENGLNTVRADIIRPVLKSIFQLNAVYNIGMLKKTYRD